MRWVAWFCCCLCLGLGLTWGVSEARQIEDRASRSEPLIVTVAKDITAQKLEYSREPKEMRDCSGIFLRALQELRQHCPNFSGPLPDKDRSSRLIAQWYADRGDAILVDDALEQDGLIHPGAILFYGSRKKSYDKVSLETLGEVEHLGIVTSVTRNRDQQVDSYQLFHGRSPGRVAGITNFHTRVPTRSSYFPLGNADQQWIAAVDLCRQSSCACRGE